MAKKSTLSPSTRRAWIEIQRKHSCFYPTPPSPSTRRAWIEIAHRKGLRHKGQSPSTRRAWIEMLRVDERGLWGSVSPSTRRAWIEIMFEHNSRDATLVALHPEGVDRNQLSLKAAFRLYHVALHPEGVDRNRDKGHYAFSCDVSPSTRRAWIEIAHRKGLRHKGQSPSTRRAWIEMLRVDERGLWGSVSPSTRRAWIEMLKPASHALISSPSPSTRRAWIEMKVLLALTLINLCRPPPGGRG